MVSAYVLKHWADFFLVARDADGRMHSSTADFPGLTRDTFIRTHERAGRTITRYTTDELAALIAPKRQTEMPEHTSPTVDTQPSLFGAPA